MYLQCNIQYKCLLFYITICVYVHVYMYVCFICILDGNYVYEDWLRLWWSVRLGIAICTVCTWAMYCIRMSSVLICYWNIKRRIQWRKNRFHPFHIPWNCCPGTCVYVTTIEVYVLKEKLEFSDTVHYVKAYVFSPHLVLTKTVWVASQRWLMWPGEEEVEKTLGRKGT